MSLGSGLLLPLQRLQPSPAMCQLLASVPIHTWSSASNRGIRGERPSSRCAGSESNTDNTHLLVFPNSCNSMSTDVNVNGMKYSDKDKARFLDKVDVQGPDDCWEWKACILSTGYGQFCVGTRRECAHRVSQELFNGGFPDPEKQICCHSCRSRSCVNPRHLRAGSIQENIDDREKDGTVPRGDRHGMAKLSEDQVREIRKLYSAPKEERPTLRELARTFGVDHTTIQLVIKHKIWKHVA